MDIKIYWAPDGSCIMQVGRTKTVLHAWVGVQLEVEQEHPRKWDEEQYFVRSYRKPEVLAYLERIGEGDETRNTVCKICSGAWHGHSGVDTYRKLNHVVASRPHADEPQ